MKKGGYVYIMTNKLKTVLYTGVTNDLCRRIFEHQSHVNPKSFTSNSNVIIAYIMKSSRTFQQPLLEKRTSNR